MKTLANNIIRCWHEPVIQRWRRRVVIALVSLLAVLALPAIGWAQADASATLRTSKETVLVTDGLSNGALRLISGKSQLLSTNRPFKRVSVAEPEIATVSPVGIRSVLVTPRKAGQTQMILWDDEELSQSIDLSVEPDMRVLREQLKALFPTARVEVLAASTSLVLKGQVPSAQVSDEIAQVAAPYAAKVVNLLEVSGGQQVMLQVRFAEVSRSASSALGVNFGFSDGRSFGGSNVGQVSPLGVKELKSEGTDLGIASPSAAVTLFGRAVAGQAAIDYFVTALRQNNLMRILAEPNLLAMSGQEASFLAGGSFPIPVAGGASVGSSPAATVEFREFGVKLNMTPVVLGDGRIRLKVMPEVSDLDYTAAVRVSGFLVPGLTQRKVSTTIELADGQTFCIAGLLNHNVTASKDVTPVLGDLPVLGVLFRSVRYQRRETELVVLVTPRVVEAMNPGQVPPVPGEKWRHPTENDLFLKTDLGGAVNSGNGPTTAPAGQSAGLPRFYGQYGFNVVTPVAGQ